MGASMTGSRQSLTAAELAAARAELLRSIGEQQATCGIRGYYFTGPSTKLRLRIQLEQGVAAPPLGPPLIALPAPIGGKLEFDIERVSPRKEPPNVTPKGLPVIRQPLAPGSAIQVDGRHGGVAFLCSLNGTGHLVTCGHLFRRVSGMQPVKVGNTVVAALVENLLPDLDAAYCELTPAGVALIEKSADAESWLQGVKSVDEGLIGDAVTFYATSGFYEEAPQTYIENNAVVQYDFRLPVNNGAGAAKVWSRVDLSGLLMTPRITIGGDSGSLLAWGGADERQYLGLCSGGGFDGSREHSFFTPIESIIKALSQKFEVTLWHP